MQNYHSLIIAGVGAVGGALLRLNFPVLESFSDIVAIDTRPMAQTKGRVRYERNDIEDSHFLASLLSRVRLPAIVVNLALEVDTVALRRELARYPVAYLDSSASTVPGGGEHRMSRLMRHTLTDVSTRYPHWVCWGTNPGLVELVARSAVEEQGFPNDGNRVDIFERDLITRDRNDGSISVSWSPHDLIDEVMRSPAMRVRDHRMEEYGTSADYGVAHWEGEPFRARLVAHEDV